MFRKYPSVFLLVGFVAGILLADLSRLPAWMFLLSCLTCGSLAAFTLAARRKLLCVWLCAGTVLFFAALRFALSCYDISADNVARYADGSHSYRIFGTVADWPNLKPELTEIKLGLDSVVAQRSLRIRGTVLLKITDTTTVIQRGDRLECYGRIYPVGESHSGSAFNYQRYLRLKGISGIVYLPTLLDVRVDRRNRYGFFELIDELRSAIRSSFYRNLSPDAAALTAGFLIGETRDIPIDLYQSFRDSGTLHLLAVSGSNVALVVAFFIAILRPFRIRRKSRALLLIGCVVIFSFLSYGEPSVLRASVMAVLVLLATMLERRYDLNNIVALAAVVILVADPGQLYDVGFQLSFITAWGLIFVLPRVLGLFSTYHNRRWYRYLIFPLIVALTAQICAGGLTILYFQRMPLLSPLANLIVVPLVSIAVVGSLVLLLADLILPTLGLMVGAWLNVLISGVIRAVQLFGSDAAPSLTFNHVSVVTVLSLYLLLALAATAITNRRLRRLAAVVLIIVVNAVLISEVAKSLWENKGIEVTCFSIPGGMAATVTSTASGPADLIVVNVKQTKYPIDERVIGPILSSAGISEIRDLFVLSAEYGALDDLCRLTSKYSVDSVFVTSAVAASLREVFSRDTTSVELPPIVTFSDRAAEQSGQGYFTFSGGVALRGKEDEIIFTNELKRVIPVVGHETRLVCVALGQSWTLTEDSRKLVKRAGINSLVCPKIEQPASLLKDWPVRISQLFTEGAVKLAFR